MHTFAEDISWYQAHARASKELTRWILCLVRSRLVVASRRKLDHISFFRCFRESLACALQAVAGFVPGDAVRELEKTAKKAEDLGLSCY